MKHTFRWYCIAAIVTAISQPLAAQEGAQETGPPGQTVDSLEPLATLESIRTSNSGLPTETDATGMGIPGMMGGMAGGEMAMGESMAPSGKQLLLQQINEVRLMLNAPNQDRNELKPLLREALAEYFILDMEERVREFDKIKARIAQMESKLQTRLDRRYDVVKLQVEQMLHKADGLDFVVPDSAATGDGMSGMGAMGMEGMGMGGGGMGAMMTGGGDMGMMGAAMGSGIPAVQGYDIGFGMTRYLRFPGKRLKPTDPLRTYLALDAKSDRENKLARLGSDASDEEKLKVLLLALHNFTDLFKHFPAPESRRYRSEKPHSWRVALLPILGHAELYKHYRFDQPWDSESNLKIIEKMPAVYGSKDDPSSSSGKTSFQMLVGGGAAFDLSGPTKMLNIHDGTSNTIALAVSNSSVPWTKPEDIQFVPNASLAKLAPSRLIGMCDGSVRKLPAGGEQMLTIFATRAGGEPIPE